MTYVGCWLCRSFVRLVRVAAEVHWRCCLAGRLRLGRAFQPVRSRKIEGGYGDGLERSLNNEQRKALAEAVENVPRPYCDVVVCWRLTRSGAMALAGGVNHLGLDQRGGRN